MTRLVWGHTESPYSLGSHRQGSPHREIELVFECEKAQGMEDRVGHRRCLESKKTWRTSQKVWGGGRDQTTRNSVSALRTEASRFLEALLVLGQQFQHFKATNSRHAQVLGPIFILASLRDISKACIHLGKVLTREHAQKTGPRLMVNPARAIYLKTILQVSKHGLNRSQMITQSGAETCHDLECYPCPIHRLEP